ncbi:iron-sulfur cluster repair di-iron protein [Sporosalibacterium faouarense]|uniref:iron-sulfur cluster repair di-iron protein n=1 Tax=Sporosalibacterium faouarense TaxID=516123 RepID=UPI00141CBF33|nr:iron-sulfur cluster repair di-iron protein [Sporosalibacterium faouarense]MTI48714.1 iron-sulfur cluster repair di-iron protein [Bacillota bacterium]
MTKVFNKKQKIGEIATIFPKATDVFMKYNIDFCCGGDRPLSEAIDEQNINEENLISELNEKYEIFRNEVSQEKDWTQESYTDLIDYIVNKHHSYMKEVLPITTDLVSKILQVHYEESGDVLSKVHSLFNSLRTEIEAHLIKEEEILFPRIKEYEKAPSKSLLDEAIKVMEETENEHDNAGDILKEIRKITNDYEVPSTGCFTFEKTYEKLQNIESDLFQHIHLENNILFERLKRN